MAERRGLYKIRAEQPPYTLLARGIETAVLPTCQRYGMGVLTWSPLAAGFLSGRFRSGQPIDMTAGRAALQSHLFDPAAPETAVKLAATERFTALAAEADCSLPELALAFTVAHPAVTSVIIGPRTREHLDSALKGAPLALDDAILDRIDEIVPPGTNLYQPVTGWETPPLTNPALRRRLPADRAAAS